MYALYPERLAEARPGSLSEWEDLILKAAASIREPLAAGTAPEKTVEASEQMLAPLGRAAVELVRDSGDHQRHFHHRQPPDGRISRLSLLAEPGLHLPDRQGLPELYETFKQRVREGRWEITANH
ncbi:MAG: hypothetical protein IT210_16155 [Armatimonadetes bacterium]|nr:hypothetical protein [Armatimonadota bacterium]